MHADSGVHAGFAERILGCAHWRTRSVHCELHVRLAVIEKIPEAVLGRLSSELATLAQSEDYRSQLVKMGLDNAISSSEVMRLQIESEIPRWQQVARAAGVKQED